MRDEFRFPDFFIAGAMKCGTTSIHYALGNHPDIFVPRGEVNYYAIDDSEQQPEVVFPSGSPWGVLDYSRDAHELRKWYIGHFENWAQKIVGEDSPVYLASSVAPARILADNPDAPHFYFAIQSKGHTRIIGTW